MLGTVTATACARKGQVNSPPSAASCMASFSSLFSAYARQHDESVEGLDVDAEDGQLPQEEQTTLVEDILTALE